MKKFILIIAFIFLAKDIQGQLINIPLVAHWTFDEKNTQDISGNSYHGTPVNTVDYVAGFDGIGNAARLYGREYNISEDGNKTLIGSHILLPKINFDSLAEFSITMWVKEDELHLWEGESYIFWGDYSKGWLGMGVFPLLDGTGNPTLYSTYAVGARQNYVDDIYPFRDFFDYDLKYKWVFYAMTYENGIIKAYRNRELLGTYNQQINISDDFAAIACHKMAGDSISARMTMDVDDVRVYHGVLQEDDLQVLQQFCNNNGVIADWGFNEEEPTEATAFDLSGNALNGKLVEVFGRDIGVKKSGRSAVFYGPFVNMPAGYLELPFVNFYHFNEFSISIWIRERNYDMLPSASYIFYGDWDDGWLGIIRKWENENDKDSPSQILFSVGGKQIENTIKVPYEKHWGNIWTNFVMTYNNGILKTYINGNNVGEQAMDINIAGNIGYSGMISRKDSTAQLFGQFEGHIDDFKISCYAMGENEIAKIYQPCDETQFNFSGFSQEDDHLLGIIGNAYIMGDMLRLSETIHEKSAVWYGQKVPVREGFETEFTFRISNGSDLGFPDGSEPGGDGFAFVIYNGGTYEIGQDNPGKANGFKGLTNSIAVEFDFYKNDPQNSFDYNDPNGNHIAIQTGRSGPNSAEHNDIFTYYITENIPIIKSDGTQIYHARIDYNVEPNRFRVFLDTDGSFSAPLIDLEDFDIGSLIELENGSKTFIGFTASTSEVMQIHDILSWSACPFFTFCDDLDEEIITNKSTPICEGDSVILSLSNAYSLFEWSNGSYGETITVKETGKYSVSVYDENGCNQESFIHIDVLPFPYPTINDGEEIIEICEGDSISLRTNDKYSSYLWSTGEQSDTIIVRAAGNYSVKVANEAGCDGEANVEIKIIELPDNILLNSGNNILCEGDTIRITAPNGASSYEWFKDGSDVSISNDEFLLVSESGKYSAEMVFGMNCVLISDTVEIDVINNDSFFAVENALNNTIDFGETTYFRNIYYPLVIQNTGERNVKLIEANLKYGVAFSIPQSQLPMEFLPNERKELILCYSPTLMGKEIDSLIIEDICLSIGLLLEGTCVEDIRSGNSRCDVPINISSQDLPAKWLSTSDPIPNPAKEEFKIEYLVIGDKNNDSDLNIKVVGILGNVETKSINMILSDKEINGRNIISGELQFDAKEIPSGLYLITIEYNGFIAFRKVLIAK